MIKNTTTKNKNSKRSLNSTEKPSLLKRFLNHPLAIPFFIFLVFGLYLILWWYTPRPLANDFTYVGRYYNSGCTIPFFRTFVCFSSGGERYYYSTDVPPEEFADKLDGWRTDYLDTGSEMFPNTRMIVNMKRSKPTDNPWLNTAEVEYIQKDNEDHIRGQYMLMPIYKKYLVEIDSGLRDRLINKSSE